VAGDPELEQRVDRAGSFHPCLGPTTNGLSFSRGRLAPAEIRSHYIDHLNTVTTRDAVIN